MSVFRKQYIFSCNQKVSRCLPFNHLCQTIFIVSGPRNAISPSCREDKLRYVTLKHSNFLISLYFLQITWKIYLLTGSEASLSFFSVLRHLNIRHIAKRARPSEASLPVLRDLHAVRRLKSGELFIWKRIWLLTLCNYLRTRNADSPNKLNKAATES